MKVPHTRYRIPYYFGDVSSPGWHTINLPEDLPLSRINPVGPRVEANLNSEWALATSEYQSIIEAAGAEYTVVMSNSNYNVNGGIATMYVNFGNTYDGSYTFKIMNRAESGYDYPTITLDDSTTLYDNTANTTSFTSINVTATGEHIMTVTFRKDGSQHSDLDRAFLAMPSSVIIL